MTHRAPPRPSQSPGGLDWLIGLPVTVTTILDDTIRGRVFAYDPVTSTVTLTSPSSFGVDLRILKTSFLKEAAADEGAVGRTTRGFSGAEPRIAAVDVGRIGRGAVSREAQEIFDALSRTMPCRWHETQIVVLDSVLISEPYGVADVKGKDQNAAKRVKKVLEGERRKLESGKRVGTPTAEKKGG